MKTEELKVFIIPEWNIQNLYSSIKKLNKRAVKLGVDEIKTNVLSSKYIDDPRLTDSQKKVLVTIPKIKIFEVTIEGNVKLNGWKFVGTLDLVTIPNAVLVNAVPNETIPSKYFKHAGHCDHCNTNRYRKETFVVENESGETKAVGRNCLKDFLGHNPTGIANFLEGLYVLIKDLEENTFEGGEHYVPSYDLLEYLEWTAAVIRLEGWVPKSAVDLENGIYATAGIASGAWIRPLGGSDSERKIWEEEHKKYTPNVHDKLEALQAHGWIAEMEDDEDLNSYFHNLKAIVDSNVVVHKTFGYAASIVSSYQRKEDRLKLKERELAEIKDEYVGEIKSRETFDVIIKKFSFWDTQYGTTTLHEFRDNEGHIIMWKSSTGKIGHGEFNVGDKVSILGTIVKHEEYKDHKQTFINRVKLKEEVK